MAETCSRKSISHDSRMSHYKADDKEERTHLCPSAMDIDAHSSRPAAILCLVLSCTFNSIPAEANYEYPIPSITPPPQFDEPFVPPHIIPTYLPPVQAFPPFNTPGIDIQPPQFDPGDTVVIPDNQYLPPSNQYLPPSNQYLPPADQHLPPSGLYVPPAAASSADQPPQVRILNMTCLENGFFNALFHMNARAPPVLDDSRGSRPCIFRDSSGVFRVQADGAVAMKECGVRQCEARLCATVRVPTVSGLQLPEDQLVSLQCAPQQAVVSHVKQVRLGQPRLSEGRALGKGAAVASGGSQRRFDTQIALLRKSSGTRDFDQPIRSGSAVHLGEELLLRSVVRDGDGWRYSRMGPVVVRSASAPRSVTLVDEQGCRPVLMRSVCPKHPRQVGPLVTSLPIRAFLFQDASPDDTMLLTVKMIACINPYDCYKGRECHDGDLEVKGRVKREDTSTESNKPNHSVTNWESSLEFRVISEPASSYYVTSNQTNNGKPSVVPLTMVSIGGIVGSIICLVVVVIKLKSKKY